jgi:ubiquitin-protein ligase
LIKIALSGDYPFKCPEIMFLDPIYHPLAKESGRFCGCSCCFSFGASGTYKPTTKLSSIVMTIIEVIDSAPATSPQSNNQERIANNYQTIFKKALESTLSYGRPRN